MKPKPILTLKKMGRTGAFEVNYQPELVLVEWEGVTYNLWHVMQLAQVIHENEDMLVAL